MDFLWVLNSRAHIVVCKLVAVKVGAAAPGSGWVHTQADVTASFPGVSARYPFSSKLKAEIYFFSQTIHVLTA